MTACTLRARESGRRLHLCKSDLTVVVRFRSRNVRIDFVITMPKYLNPVSENLKGFNDEGSSAANWLMAKHSLFKMFSL